MNKKVNLFLLKFWSNWNTTIWKIILNIPKNWTKIDEKKLCDTCVPKIYILGSCLTTIDEARLWNNLAEDIKVWLLYLNTKYYYKHYFHSLKKSKSIIVSAFCLFKVAFHVSFQIWLLHYTIAAIVISINDENSLKIRILRCDTQCLFLLLLLLYSGYFFLFLFSKKPTCQLHFGVYI